MISNRNVLPKVLWTLPALLVVATCSSIEAAGRMYAGPFCHGLNGPCVPARVTHGYVPTTWRRWPGNAPAEGEKPSAGQLPTRAAEPTPSVEPEGPTIAPEETPLMPTESEPARPKSETEETLIPPFDDTPPGPPTTTQPETKPPAAAAPADSPPPTTLPEPPPQMRLPSSDEDPPPSMPQDDPFKDDPPTKSSDAPTKGGRTNDVGERQAAMHWQAAEGSTEPLGENPPAKADGSAEPPRLLTPDEGGPNAKGVLPISPPIKQNPLRAAAQQTRPARVTPAAHFSSERRAANAAVETSRRNPLRPN